MSPQMDHGLKGFAVVAGCGWLIDTICLLALSRIAEPGFANVASSLTAASFVYLVSHRYVHEGRQSLVGLRLGVYAVYTLGLVLIASLALARIVSAVRPCTSATAAIVCAKIIITPPQFFCNFVMSRFLARLQVGAA
jgi:putative flippase GtrA